jgi:CSLREA domain-containing protein
MRDKYQSREDLMAYLVNIVADIVDPADGKLSLREAVAKANSTAAADTIVFAANLQGMTLVLTQGELGITRDLTIDGDGRAITIDGNATGRIFNIAGAGTEVALRGLTLTNGFAEG